MDDENYKQQHLFRLQYLINQFLILIFENTNTDAVLFFHPIVLNLSIHACTEYHRNLEEIKRQVVCTTIKNPEIP